MTERITADVCLVVEGAYPYVVGGVSSWLQDVIGHLPDIRFAIVAIKADHAPTPWRITPPSNVVEVVETSLTAAIPARRRRRKAGEAAELAQLLLAFLDRGDLQTLGAILRLLRQARPAWTPAEVLAHPALFQAVQDHAAARLPASSFHHYYWALRTLLGGLLSALLVPLPRARMYHTISTGFAGLIAARATLETSRPAAITEHGIYQLERQIEIMMVDWVGDRIDSGLSIESAGRDLRDVWKDAFSSYARVCYEACDPIIALYNANSRVQRRLGADPDRLRVIPNGIDPARFADLPDARDPSAPLVALIGRVVPIKDVKTFIRAAAAARAALPAARFVVLGPTDEDAEYAAECFALVEELRLADVLTFAGRVDVAAWLSRVDVVVLTSLSEAQPLVILEAGACGVPAIAPDVGSCREMIEGRGVPGDTESGGIVTALVDPQATAAAMVTLLADPGLRRRMGETLRERVRRDYTHAGVIYSYRSLYEDLMGAPGRGTDPGDHRCVSNPPQGEDALQDYRSAAPLRTCLTSVLPFS